MIQTPDVYHVPCPHCTRKSKINAEYVKQISNASGYLVLRCGMDSGNGCGWLFVAHIILEPVVTTMKLEKNT